MDSAHATASKTSPDVSTLSSVQKLAALLLMLSPDNAAVILKSLDERELDAVSSEMAKFTTISQELQHQILSEFSTVAVDAGTAISGGPERVQGLLEKSVGLVRASDIICRVSPSRPSVAGMQQIVEMDARHIFNLLRGEQLQTIALVVSYLTPEKASQLLSMLNPELHEQVIERLATLAPTSVEVVGHVAELLQNKCATARVRPLSQTGGVKAAAQVLNALPKNLSKSILLALKERNSELGEAVREKMFTFEELERLDPKSLQKLLQAIDMQTLTIALKTASEKLKNKLLSCISKRAAESVREEMQFMGPVKLREIDAAQLKIIEVVRQLESEGEIDLEELRQEAK
jgi:flagellar motor switch protein FliG